MYDLHALTASASAIPMHRDFIAITMEIHQFRQTSLRKSFIDTFHADGSIIEHLVFSV